MRRVALMAAIVLALGACGGSSTGPQLGPPTLSLVNGVSLPSGLIGSTVLIEGTNFGDAAHGTVLFTPAGGTPIQATIANPATDWSSTVIVTTVPSGVTASSTITVRTAAGTTNAITFELVSNAAFSPSTITWSPTTNLPQPLQGLGAAYMPVRIGSTPANYVFVLGGADSLTKPTTAIYRASVQSTGALASWQAMPIQLPHARAYATTAAATVYTTALDTTTTAGFLYVMGGEDSSLATVATVLYAPVAPNGTAGAWQETTPLPAPMHSGGATAFRGYLYLVGGAGATNAAMSTAYRAQIHTDGSLGAWQAIASLPQASGYLAVSNFGPYLYAAGGDAGTVAPLLNTASGTETNAVTVARINVRDGTLTSTGWTTLGALGKGRSKHGLIISGGALLVTSGVYGGSAGSSENTYATINADGTIGSWNGATGTNTISSVLGYSLYNEAALSFTDKNGTGHVMVLGGADRAVPGKASKAVVYY